MDCDTGEKHTAIFFQPVNHYRAPLLWQPYLTLNKQKLVMALGCCPKKKTLQCEALTERFCWMLGGYKYYRLES